MTRQWDRDHKFTPKMSAKIPKGRPCDWCGKSMGRQKGYVHKACFKKEWEALADLAF